MFRLGLRLLRIGPYGVRKDFGGVERVMTATTLEMSVRAREDETPKLEELASHLDRENPDEREVRITDALGHELVVPASVMRVLPMLVRELAKGSAVAVVPLDAELTTQQAADFLSVSRPYLVRLLDAKDIPSHRVGSHRRVRFDDVLSYKRERDSRRRSVLRRMAAESSEQGLEY